MNGEAFMQIALAVISLIGAVITYVVVPYFKKKTDLSQQQSILFWVNTAVKAAEQIFAGEGLGRQKKQYVLKFLKNHGIELTEEALTILIEAAVLELNRSKSLIA